MSPTLPNFLMIGAPRTGSTALHHALRQHPDFFLPQGKETHFFSAGGDPTLADMHALGFMYRAMSEPDEYARCFAEAAAFSQRGEIDPSILKHAAFAIPKLRAMLRAETKWIVTLRQPIERAYSHYRLHVGYGADPQRFETYLKVQTPRTIHERVALDRYFRHSFYFETLKLFFDAFGREKFLVLLYDDLQADPRAFMQNILEFLSADTRVLPSFTPEINAGLAPVNFWGRMRSPQHPLRRFLRACTPRLFRAGARRAVNLEERVQRGFGKPALAPETRARLMPRYRDDILRTQDLIQRELEHWLV